MEHATPRRDHLRHFASTFARGIVIPALLTAFALLGSAESAAAANRWDEMEYGPFLSSSVTIFDAHPEDPRGITEKGITVTLDDGKAAVCFDTDLLCYSAGWTGG